MIGPPTSLPIFTPVMSKASTPARRPDLIGSGKSITSERALTGAVASDLQSSTACSRLASRCNLSSRAALQMELLNCVQRPRSRQGEAPIAIMILTTRASVKIHAIIWHDRMIDRDVKSNRTLSGSSANDDAMTSIWPC